MPKKQKEDPLDSSGFVCYVKKVENIKGGLCNNLGAYSLYIRLVEQTEQQFRRIQVCLKENKPRTAQVGAISKAQ